jgi:hypothetical protein
MVVGIGDSYETNPWNKNWYPYVGGENKDDQ